MRKVEDISVINIEGVPVSVSELSEPVRELIDIYNMWRQDEADARLELMKTQAALQDVSRQIGAKVKEENDAASEEDTTEE